MNHGKHLIKIEHKGKACPEETTVTKHTVDPSHLLHPSRTFIGYFANNPRHPQDSRVHLWVKVKRFCIFRSHEGFDKLKYCFKKSRWSIWACFEFKPFLFFQLSTYGYTDDLWI